MEIHDKLQEQLHAAMKAHDERRKWTIRMLIFAIKLAEVEKGHALNDQEFMAVVQKEIKTRKDTLEDAHKANREDIIRDTETEISILQEYLPSQFNEVQLAKLANEVIREVGAESPKEIGKVLKALLPKLAGRATNADASRVVKELLEKTE
ncbi:MAG: GatB/YqeY domain-containing protein [Chloroflexi bacterium]|nr:GatB/YqeY domain-containing protein [Chloroflexota bacterium]